MFRFWKWIPQNLDLLVTQLAHDDYETDRLAELMESYSDIQYETDIWLQYQRDEKPN